VPQGHSYTSVVDHFAVPPRAFWRRHGSVATDAAGRKLTRTSTPAGPPQAVVSKQRAHPLGARRRGQWFTRIPTPVDEPSADLRISTDSQAAARNASGKWVQRVDLNVGGVKRFINGPWKAKYGLGTYGVDWRSHTVWAVVDHAGQFALSASCRPLTAPALVAPRRRPRPPPDEGRAAPSGLIGRAGRCASPPCGDFGRRLSENTALTSSSRSPLGTLISR